MIVCIVLGRKREMPCVFAVLNDNSTRWVEKAMQLIYLEAYTSLAMFVEGIGK